MIECSKCESPVLPAYAKGQRGRIRCRPCIEMWAANLAKDSVEWTEEQTMAVWTLHTRLSKEERKGLGLTFAVLKVLAGLPQPPPPWRGLPCEARQKRKGQPVCGKGAITVRTFEAAPGMWVHIVLCHRHAYVWDQCEDWGGGIAYREKICDGGCPRGECRGEDDEPRGHLWFTAEEIEDLHAGLNHLYNEGNYQFSRCGPEGIRDMNTQLKAALRSISE